MQDAALTEKITKRDEIILVLRKFKEMNPKKYSIIKIGIFGSAARDGMKEFGNGGDLIGFVFGFQLAQGDSVFCCPGTDHVNG